MRRRLSLFLVGMIIGIGIIILVRHRAPSVQPSRSDAAVRTRADSAAQPDTEPRADTTCFASRVGVPCAPL